MNGNPYGHIKANWHGDAAKRKDPHLYVGRRYFHPKTGHLYQITSYGIDAERGLWLLFYVQIVDDGDHGAFTYSHTMDDFDREGRFMLVKT